MKEQLAIQLEAWFDGEATPSECAEIEALLIRDPEAKAYVDGLNQTREVLQGAHLNASRGGAAWEVLRERLDGPGQARSSRTLSFPQLLAATAAVVALGMALWLPMRKMGYQDPEIGPESMVYMVETDLEGATPIVYIDQPSGWTVVWVVEAEESNPG